VPEGNGGREREDAHSEVAKERWGAHRDQHFGERELAEQKWESHKEQHGSIARNLAEYKAQSNEWRGSLNDLRSSFAPISQLDALESHVNSRLEELAKSLATEREERRDQQNIGSGRREGVISARDLTLAVIGLVVSVAFVVLGIIAFVKP